MIFFLSTDEHSDSEESNTTTSGHRVPKGYPQKSYYSRFTYSSQSTPTRRYQCDGTKSTRSSSTASENKITFNEGEFIASMIQRSRRNFPVEDTNHGQGNDLFVR
jgi:hypothetical protein